MIESYVICIIIAVLIKKYSLRYILKYWGTYIFICVEIFYVYMQISLFNGDYDLLKYEQYLKPLFILVLLVFVFKYNIYIQTIIASAFMAFGHILNYIVMKANNGYMPVFPTISKYTNFIKNDMSQISQQYNTYWVPGDSHTKLKFLSDIWDTGYCIMSLGDIFISIGAAIVLFYAIKKSKDFAVKIDMTKLLYNVISLRFIRLLSCKCSISLHKFLKNNNQKAYTKYLYNYSFKFFFSTLYDLLLIMTISYLSGVFKEAMIIMLASCVFRVLTGGIHMNALWKCAYIWLTMFLASGLITKKLALLNIQWHYILVPVVILLLVIILNYTEFRKHKITVIVLMTFVILYIIFSTKYYISIALTMGIYIQMITLIPYGKKMFISISALLDKIFLHIKLKHFNNNLIKGENL